MRQCCLSHQVLQWLLFLILYAACGHADILVFTTEARHQIEEELRDMPAKFGGLIPTDGIKVCGFNSPVSVIYAVIYARNKVAFIVVAFVLKALFYLPSTKIE